MINPFFFVQEVSKVSNSTKISNLIFWRVFIIMWMWKKTHKFASAMWSTVEEVSFEWSHMFFINITIFLPGSQWSHGFFWFLNLKWFATSYWHHDSSVSCFCGSCSPQSLVHVLVEDHKTKENLTCTRTRIIGRVMRNTNHEKSHKYQRLKEAREEPECWSK